jgi:fumarylpyruvate hydrolase
MKLSQLFQLAPGDLIYTGTPAGVGPLQSGDLVHGRIEAIGELGITFR